MQPFDFLEHEACSTAPDKIAPAMLTINEKAYKMNYCAYM